MDSSKFQLTQVCDKSSGEFKIGRGNPQQPIACREGGSVMLEKTRGGDTRDLVGFFSCRGCTQAEGFKSRSVVLKEL